MGNTNDSNPALLNPCQSHDIRCNEYQHTMNSECVRCPMYGALVRHSDAVWAQPVATPSTALSSCKPTGEISTSLAALAREVASKLDR